MRTLGRAVLMVASACLGAGLALGCGGDDSDGAGDVTTGIAPSKLLADVSASEAAQACERLEAGFSDAFGDDDIIRTFCTLLGAALADTSADCATQRDMCIQDANQAGSMTMMAIPTDEIDFECGEGTTFTGCAADATVGQLETCFNDMLDVVRGAFNQVTCDDAASVSMDDLQSFGENAFQPPTSCETLECEDSPFGGE
jgi:hypothetical protein